jgi:hypothetical protein
MILLLNINANDPLEKMTQFSTHSTLRGGIEIEEFKMKLFSKEEEFFMGNLNDCMPLYILFKCIALLKFLCRLKKTFFN